LGRWRRSECSVPCAGPGRRPWTGRLWARILNGFILLLHIGSGPGRADKFEARFGELLEYLAGKGYQFVRVDDLLGPRRQAKGVHFDTAATAGW
jgi:peptidoglycan/xylan/chitin deacetylase (PgdA/CDA1 family)